MPESKHYDAIIIGSGAGGGTLALKLSQGWQAGAFAGTRELPAA